jgi:hypothetical protein
MMQINKKQGQVVLIGMQGTYEVRGGLPDALPALPGFISSVFNQPKHLTTQRLKHPFTIWLWDTVLGSTVALLHLDRDGSHAISLQNAPFGAVEFREGTPAEALHFFMDCVVQWCQQQRLTHLTIKAPPGAYAESTFLHLHEVYQKSGFRIAHHGISHHLPVDSQPFETWISASERRRLRKCRRAGFVAELWARPVPSVVYAFLAENRQRLGYALPLGPDTLSHLLLDLPHDALVFVVRQAHRILSLAVVLRINHRILYNFAPADDLDYRRFSPTVLLNAALYEYAQSEGYTLIDLGVSENHWGQEKPSLIRFKENLGGRPSPKLTYERVFG